MSKIHYFQRYDSKENWITNSTLLLLSRLYYLNRLKFENVLNLILEENNVSLNIGVNFGQQERGNHSVVDGIISQDSFKIVIETKLYDNFTADQLKRHLDALTGNYDKKILLALSKNKVNSSIRYEVIKAKQSDEKYNDIEFAITTYENLVEVLKNNLSEYDIEMQEILDDYVSLCQQHGLFNIAEQTLLAFAATESLKENFKYNIYYDPVARNHNLPFKFIGLYANKIIQGVGEVKKIVVCNYVDGAIVPADDTRLDLTNDEYKRIKETIENTSYYDLSKGEKFFLVDKFHKTNFKKSSFSSLRGKRYFFLEENGYKSGMSSKEVAALLDNKTWE